MDTNVQAPVDRWNLAYLIFFWLGAGFLFPWNAFITGVDYFAMLYPTAHIDFVFAIVYMGSSLTMVLLVMRFGKGHSSKSRVFLGFSLFLCLILLVPTLDMVVVKGGRGSSLSLFLTVSAVFCSGIIDGITQGSLFGIAGQLPEKYTQALVAGTSASGVIISFARIVTKIALPGNLEGLRVSATAYFLLSSVFIALCLVGFTALQKLPVFEFFESQKTLQLNKISVLCEEELEPSSADISEQIDSDKALLIQPSDSTPPSGSFLGFYLAFLEVWEYAVALSFVYIVTLSIFPGFISEALHSDWMGDWYPVLLFFNYNVSDFIGKLVPSVWVVHSKQFLIAGTYLRVLFYPLFGLCVYFSHSVSMEAVFFGLTAVFGFSNGIFTSWLMMTAPKLVNFDKAEAVGFIMVLFLIVGLFVGSFAGWAWILVL